MIVPEVRDSLENAVCLDLMISCLTQQMIQDTYPADLAQLQYSVNSGITREMGKEGRHCIIIYQNYYCIAMMLVTFTEVFCTKICQLTNSIFSSHYVKPKLIPQQLAIH